MTGCGVIVRTGFNVGREPIVCTPEDAYRCFMRTKMDVLVMEDCILYKEEQPKFARLEFELLTKPSKLDFLRSHQLCRYKYLG